MGIQSHTWELDPRRLSGDPSNGCTEWCAPLHLIEQAVAGKPMGQDFSVDDFQIGPRLVRPGKPNLHLYKHGFTRTFLNVDTDGRTYRFIPPKASRGGAFGRYLFHRSLADAINDLLLHELAGVQRPARLRLVRESAPYDDIGSAGGVGPAA